MRKITNEELNRPSAGEFAAMEKMPVAVVLDNVRSLQNVGAFFRTGDAFAVERIALCGITATPPNRDIHKTALGAELTVPWTYHKTTEECIARLRRWEGSIRSRSENVYRRSLRILENNPTARARQERGEVLETLRRLLDR